MNDTHKVQASGGSGRPQADDAAPDTSKATGGGESGGGAYPNPHGTDAKGPSNPEVEYSGPGQPAGKSLGEGRTGQGG